MPVLRVSSRTITIGKGHGNLALKHIHVRNFRSFKDASINFKKLNLLIGANASGKSNFVNILRFLRDLFQCGLDDAISMQGGIEYLRNVDIGASDDISIDVIFSQDSGGSIPFHEKKKLFRFVVDEVTYSLKIGFSKTRTSYFVKEEKLGGSFSLQTSNRPKRVKWEHFMDGKILVTRDSALKINVNSTPQKLPFSIETLFPFVPLTKVVPIPKKSVNHLTYLTEVAAFSPLFGSMHSFITSMKLYSIDPKLSKEPSVITGKTELESDGKNLAVVLKHLLSDKKRKAKFLNLVRELLPFVKDTCVFKLEDSSLLMFQREDPIKKRLPAILISDGTINIIALITALFFGREPLIVIEEPERNIHPALISKLVDMIKDVSERMERQVIVTTHHPQFVKNVKVENMLLVSRDESGFSQVSSPSDNKEVQLFLKNEIGIDELFIQGLLGD